MPDDEFVLWTIVDFEKRRGQFKYELPKNVVLVQENSMEAALKLQGIAPTTDDEWGDVKKGSEKVLDEVRTIVSDAITKIR